MALTKLTTNVENIQALSLDPNEIEGLTGPQLQKKFDDAGISIKDYINNTLTTEIDTKTQYLDAINSIQTQFNTGWYPISATLAYSSANAPTFVATTSTDLTSTISVGMKLKLTQTTVKYFIVTAITSNSITLYGGTDYTLANATINNVYFSNVKTPYGWNNSLNYDMDIIKVSKSTVQNLTTQTYTNITLDSQIFKIGVGLELLNNNIYIRKSNIKAVSITTVMQFNVSAYHNLYITKNNTAFCNSSINNSNMTLTTSINVVKDDYININVYTYGTNDSINNDTAWTNLIVQAIY